MATTNTTVPLKEAAPSPKPAGSEVFSANATGTTDNGGSNPTQVEAEDAKPSVRYNRLSQISKRALQETFKHFTYEKLASCYPNIASTPGGKHALEQALIQITRFFNDTALKEFDAIYTERKVNQQMVELDQLIEEARQRQAKHKEGNEMEMAENVPVYLDQLTPEVIIQAHLLPLQKAEEERLAQQLEELKRENEAMLEQLVNGNQRAMALLDSLSKAVTDLQATNKSTDKMPPRTEIVASIQAMTKPVD